MEKKKAAFHTLGCKVNTYETDAMEQMMREGGYEIVPFDRGADVYIINTCSVTNMADHKSRQMLRRARKLNPDAVIVAVGCYVQADPEKAAADTGADLVIGNNKKKELVSILGAYLEGKTEESVVDIGAQREYEALELGTVTDHTRAYIKVQDGCNQFCSYCIIPYTRGRIRSRNADDVAEEIARLAADGIKEVVLTGIHLSSYGKDWEGKEELLRLIQRIHGIEGIERIRLGSLEPRIVTEAFARELGKMEKLCPHFHLSLQSGSDSVLKRMNRHYTAGEYLRGCEILRTVFENPAITTDVIVGFPGETEEEFLQTKKFLEEVRFFEMHIFKYSPRKGTRAAAMKEQVPESVKTERSKRLLCLEQEMSEAYRRSFIGTDMTILLESILCTEQGDYMLGHSREYVKAAFPIPKGGREEDYSNRMVTARAVGMLKDDIVLLA